MSEQIALLVQKYIKKFGENWAGKAQNIIDKITKAVESRGFGTLRNLSYVK